MGFGLCVCKMQQWIMTSFACLCPWMPLLDLHVCANVTVIGTHVNNEGKVRFTNIKCISVVRCWICSVLVGGTCSIGQKIH